MLEGSPEHADVFLVLMLRLTKASACVSDMLRTSLAYLTQPSGLFSTVE